ncbi:phage tail tape measure, TP901 family, core region domain protein [Clostridioides difficile Y215]|nr:phage tail tape measure, TP901 family, core region domain protein [Clostridioides difficile CD3]EQG32437.1 phage tail tape measure, TP901 family, core region domain protein [Clostridioides difficile DA00126]EQG71558.1 phage tail tape measure, TP901 family, core region domain protein [Clostridioides difficile DA00142]EQG78548.1 phage tail tape measure, TP901 family, core region domain protein [Clostridioides difficile DA00165]EQH16590.1 phage tail tape measure, TP901 family, core region domai
MEPTYLNVSPINSTLVLEFVMVAAITSTNSVVSFAVNPNAVKPSVTISILLYTKLFILASIYFYIVQTISSPSPNTLGCGISWTFIISIKDLDY